jgi:hypothetical protein
MPICPWSGAWLQAYYDVAYDRYVLGDTNPDGSRWITTEGGQHVLIDKDGEIIGGMGGEHNGQTMREAGGETKPSAAGSAKISPSGANKFKVKGFASPRKFDKHWKDHQKDYPGLTKEQYAKRALDLLQKPVGGSIIGHVNQDGVVVRYDAATNEFAKGHPDKGIKTLYKPTRGKDYYVDNRKDDLKNGGRS